MLRVKPTIIVKKIINRFFAIIKWYIFKIAKNWVILNNISKRIRPFLWKLTGVQVKGKINIGYDVYYDIGYASSIIIEEGVWIASRSLLLCHKRDLNNYFIYDDYNQLPHTVSKIVLKKGCVIGMGAIVMPGVTINEGAIVGAGAIVVKDVPAWSIVTGNPARVIKVLKSREVFFNNL